MQIGPTKSVAGSRTVRIPELLSRELRRHLAEFVWAEADALIFTGEKGAVLRRSNFRRAVGWATVVAKAGLPDGFHFHDLRRTGNHLAASSGASTRELMHRMGHGSMRAALIYQHATNERDRQIAERLNQLVREQRGEDDEGTAGVLVPVR